MDFHEKTATQHFKQKVNVNGQRFCILSANKSQNKVNPTKLSVLAY